MRHSRDKMCSSRGRAALFDGHLSEETGSGCRCCGNYSGIVLVVGVSAPKYTSNTIFNHCERVSCALCQHFTCGFMYVFSPGPTWRYVFGQNDLIED